MPGCHIAIYNDFRGPNNSLTQREASSNLAVIEASHIIARGDADLIVAGATGTRIHPMRTIHALHQEQVASANGQDPAAICRPFDLHRTGMVLGEGAGALVLEEYQHALNRGATLYAEVVGGGCSFVAERSLVARRNAALVNAIGLTLRDAGVAPAQVGHVHAHGLSTRSCDVEEARAIKAVFGEPSDQPPLTAAKSYFGNLGAGGGAVELICSILALKHRQLFGVLNYQTPDPECPLAINSAHAAPGLSCLNVNVTPQGHASCVLVQVVR
jgi:3-oxoacyl-[acyl-carrier-protein] synthase II